jgi:hypothetical protein
MLVEKDSVQASDKLYKAAEEAVKVLALHFGLSDVLEKVERGAAGPPRSSRRLSKR